MTFCSEYSKYSKINAKAIDKSPTDQPTSVSQGKNFSHNNNNNKEAPAESKVALWTNFNFCCSINIMLLLCEKKIPRWQILVDHFDFYLLTPKCGLSDDCHIHLGIFWTKFIFLKHCATLDLIDFSEKILFVGPMCMAASLA